MMEEDFCYKFLYGILVFEFEFKRLLSLIIFWEKYFFILIGSIDILSRFLNVETISRHGKLIYYHNSLPTLSSTFFSNFSCPLLYLFSENCRL